jgi:saccharopine dehydrogenase-like NADP-dependent oxidoreductase
MRVIILGTGGVGVVIAQDLERHPGITHLAVADVDLSRAKQLERKMARLTAHRVDATDYGQLKKLLQSFNLVINALPPECNQNVMRASWYNGANYLDMASGTIQGETIDESLQKQLELDENWKKSGLIALLHAGITPGITNIVAREGVDRFDKPTRIIIRNFGRIDSQETISLWSPITALRDKASAPLVFRNGAFQRVQPFEGEEEYEFPEIGKNSVVYYEHEEVCTLPRFIPGLSDVEYKMGGFDVAKYRILFKEGLLSDRPIKMDSFQVSPLQLLAAMTPPTITPQDLEKKIQDGTIKGSVSSRIVEVQGEKDQQKSTLSFQILHPDVCQAFQRIWGANHISYATGISAAAFAKAILEGKIEKRGVFAPECLDSEARKFVFDDIRQYNIRVEQLSP